jgi:transposase
MRGKAHTDETRAAALAALLEGQGVSQVAKVYRLPESTVRDLKKSIDSEKFAEVRAKKEESLASLIENHLRQSLSAAANIANQTTNADWLAKQDAEKLGVFYGILTDKAVRILEAGEAAQSEDDESDV